MKRALLIFLLSASPLAGAAAGENQTVKSLLEQKGPPAFTAASVEARGTRLVCRTLELVDPAEINGAETLRGVILLYCEPWDALALSVASLDARMRRATPFLGQERPGAKFSGEPAAKPAPSKLLRPARVFVAFIDERGAVRRTADLTVREVQLLPQGNNGCAPE